LFRRPLPRDERNGSAAPVLSRSSAGDYVKLSAAQSGTMPAFVSAPTQSRRYLNRLEYATGTRMDARFVVANRRLFLPLAMARCGFVTTPVRSSSVRTLVRDYHTRFSTRSAGRRLFMDNPPEDFPFVGRGAFLEPTRLQRRLRGAMNAVSSGESLPKWDSREPAGGATTAGPIVANSPHRLRSFFLLSPHDRELVGVGDTAARVARRPQQHRAPGLW